jgi:poly [ADP-ribose] polymerase
MTLQSVLLLVEVALGKSYRAQEAEDLSYSSLKETHGCDSTHGIGRMAAPEDEYVMTPEGVVVPIGEFEPSDGDGSLLYNEFIVYRSEQVRLRYVVTLDILFEGESAE